MHRHEGWRSRPHPDQIGLAFKSLSIIKLLIQLKHMQKLKLCNLFTVLLLLSWISIDANAAKKVACMGNSITYGATIGNDTDKYPYQFYVAAEGEA